MTEPKDIELKRIEGWLVVLGRSFVRVQDADDKVHHIFIGKDMAEQMRADKVKQGSKVIVRFMSVWNNDNAQYQCVETID